MIWSVRRSVPSAFSRITVSDEGCDAAAISQVSLPAVTVRSAERPLSATPSAAPTDAVAVSAPPGPMLQTVTPPSSRPPVTR